MAATGKRGRPSAENPAERVARLKRELAAAEALVKEAYQRRYIVLGEAVAAEAQHDPALKATLAEIIAKRIKSASAKVELAELLAA